jgi:hypothetical protein
MRRHQRRILLQPDRRRAVNYVADISIRGRPSQFGCIRALCYTCRVTGSAAPYWCAAIFLLPTFRHSHRPGNRTGVNP